MNVLHMISGGDTGGAKTHVFSLMSALPQYCNVKIVCFLKGDFFDELQNIDVPSELIEQKNRFDLSVLTRLCQICREENIDIIHAHGARANFIASRLKKKVSIPVVTTVHSDYLLDFDGLYKKIVYTSLNVHSLRKLDYYIGVSSNFKDMLISRRFRPNSVFTVYNGMDYSSPMSYCSKEEFVKRLGITYDPSKTYVGLIGRHDYVKGHDIFIKAAAHICKMRDDVVFIIAGEGDTRQSLLALAKKLGVSDKIVFAGFIKDIYSFINFIDINTLCSRCESFPYVLMEGARLRKPTVCSDVGGISDLVEDTKTGLLFENENFLQFADKILTFIDNKDFAKECADALYERATSTFSNQSLAKTHLSIYNQILYDYNSKNKYDAVLSGYYGFNNSGDDALLLGIIQSMQKIFPGVRLCVLSNSPMETRKRYRTDSDKRFSIIGVNRALKNAGLLINGGGSLIQDATSLKSLLYYLYVIHLAQKKHIPVFVYANGIGPISQRNSPLAARILKKCQAITLRDSLSLAELSKMGLDTTNIPVTCDPAVMLEPEDKERVLKSLQLQGIPVDKKILLISVRPWEYNDKNFSKKIANICDTCYEKHGLVSVFLPMKPSSDLKFSQNISLLTKHKSFVITKQFSVCETIGIISCSDVVLGMRLHSLIYALCANVACVGLLYDPKIDGFLKDIGNNLICSASDIDCDKLLSTIEYALENSQSIKEDMQSKLSILRDKALGDARTAITLSCGQDFLTGDECK